MRRRQTYILFKKKKLGRYFGLEILSTRTHLKLLQFFLHKKDAFTFLALCVNNWHLKQLRRSQNMRHASSLSQGAATLLLPHRNDCWPSRFPEESDFSFMQATQKTDLGETVFGVFRDIEPIPVAARSKAWVCGRLLAGIVGSNPAYGMDVCLL
jgi:hypothetical protein